MTQNMKWWTVPTALIAIVIGAAVATPAHAWSWPWQKNSPPAASQSGSAPATATPGNAVPAVQASAPVLAPSKPVAAMTADPKTIASSKVFGTLESVDAVNDRLSLKTQSGKTESFTLAKSSKIFEHHKMLTLSSLKTGERVSVHYRSGSNEVSRVYVLESKKA